jgi:hypothetical protein
MEIPTRRSTGGRSTTAPRGRGRSPSLAQRLLSILSIAVAIALAATDLAFLAPAAAAQEAEGEKPSLAGDRLPYAPMAGYQLTDAFGEIPGVTQVDGVGIADDGTIAGNYVFNGRERAFRARPDRPFD